MPSALQRITLVRRALGGSHHFFSMPWQGDPLVNLQESGKLAKAYQVRQLLSAIERLERERHA